MGKGQELGEQHKYATCRSNTQHCTLPAVKHAIDLTSLIPVVPINGIADPRSQRRVMPASVLTVAGAGQEPTKS